MPFEPFRNSRQSNEKTHRKSVAQYTLTHIEYAHVTLLAGRDQQLMLRCVHQTGSALFVACECCEMIEKTNPINIPWSYEIRMLYSHATSDFFCGSNVSHMPTFLLSEL